VVSHRKACGKAQLQARGSLAGLQTLQSNAVVERPKSSAAEHRLQPPRVLVSVAAAQSEDSLATASLARRLLVRVQVNRELERNNPDSIDLRPHRLPVQVQAKREVEEKEGRVRMVNLAASQKADRLRLLQLSAGKRSPSAERKRARRLHRHEDHNNFLLITLAAPKQKPGPLFLGVSYRAFAAANATTAALQFAPRSVLRL
jgi:hypothetical protein